MNSADTIRSLMKKNGILQKDLQAKLGMKSSSGITQVLQRDMKTSMLVRLLSAMDCQLIIRTDSGEEIEITE